MKDKKNPLLPEPSKAMLTELCLSADEFEHFAVQAHSSITFCLKELRVRREGDEEVNLKPRRTNK